MFCRVRFRMGAARKRRHKMKATVLLFVLGSVACEHSPGAAAPVVQTVGAVGAPFAQYRTFAFGLAEKPPAPYAISERGFEVERRAQPLIVAELTNKGYAVSDDGKGDFLVRFSVGYAKIAIPQPGSTEGGLGSTEYQNVGEVVIDAFDGSSRTQVWHGSAEAQIDPKKINDRLLQTAVRQLLVRFPSRPESGATDRQPR
jgi:hypothetical protein